MPPVSHPRGMVSVLALMACIGCKPDPSYQGRSADDWGRLLARGSSSARLMAASAFENAPPHTLPNVRALLAAAADSNLAIRTGAERAIGRLSSDATKALAKTLRDTSVAVRRRAAFVLGDRGQDRERAVPALVTAIDDSDDSVRTLAVQSLGRLGLAYEAVTRVRELATRPGPQRTVALLALPNIDVESRTLLPVYSAALNDTNAEVRIAAAMALHAGARDMSISSNAPPGPAMSLVALLQPLLSDHDHRVRIAALRALADVGQHDTAAISAAEPLRTSTDTAVRRVADSVFATLLLRRVTGGRR